jgi:hypothetical protein
MTGHRQTKGPDEADAFTSWRKLYCYTSRAGVCKKIKRQANRRERREARRSIVEHKLPAQ